MLTIYIYIYIFVILFICYLCVCWYQMGLTFICSQCKCWHNRQTCFAFWCKFESGESRHSCYSSSISEHCLFVPNIACVWLWQWPAKCKLKRCAHAADPKSDVLRIPCWWIFIFVAGWGTGGGVREAPPLPQRRCRKRTMAFDGGQYGIQHINKLTWRCQTFSAKFPARIPAFEFGIWNCAYFNWLEYFELWTTMAPGNSDLDV